MKSKKNRFSKGFWITINLNAQLIALIGEKEKKYHLSSISNTLSKTNGKIITVQDYSGALCSCLLAIDYLDDDESIDSKY